MICPSGYNSVNSLFYLNDYSGSISGQGKLTVDTIVQCRTKCDEHHNCYAFDYNDEQKLCNLERYRRPNRHTMNTRWCSKPGIYSFFLVLFVMMRAKDAKTKQKSRGYGPVAH